MSRGWWLAVAGCAPTTPAEVEFTSSTEQDCPGAALEVTCGGDETASFTTAMPGQPATLVHGPAGGWGVIFGLDVFGAQQVLTAATLTAPTHGERTVGDAELALSLPGPCGGQTTGVWMLFNPYALDAEADPLEVVCAFVGEPMRLRVEVSDLANAERSGYCELLLTAALDPQDVELCAAL
jgi:hypothetical protein